MSENRMERRVGTVSAKPISTEDTAAARVEIEVEASAEGVTLYVRTPVVLSSKEAMDLARYLMAGSAYVDACQPGAPALARGAEGAARPMKSSA